MFQKIKAAKKDLAENDQDLKDLKATVDEAMRAYREKLEEKLKNHTDAGPVMAVQKQISPEIGLLTANLTRKQRDLHPKLSAVKDEIAGLYRELAAARKAAAE